MRGIRISDLRRHHLHRYLIIQQFTGVFQLILLIISKQRLAVIFFEIGLQRSRTRGRNTRQLLDARELLLIMKTKMLLRPRKTMRVLLTEAIPVFAELIHNEEL